ncbi:MAG: T9SS type A sorting domain-containing protein [Saprospiraceae bacterium]|nr:T9SS type A sorting domain-containing protein [Saprospiraceae bacterium]
MMKNLLMVVMATCIFSFGYSQQTLKPIDLVKEAKNNNQLFNPTAILEIDSRTTRADLNIEDNITDYNIFNIAPSSLKAIQGTKSNAMELSIPSTYRSQFDLELVKVNIFTEDFSVVKGSDKTAVNYNEGVHYRGIIKGDPTSIAAVSFYNDEVIGLISSEDGNLVIGKLKNSNKHIIYDDFNVITDLGLECGTIDDGIGYKPEELRNDTESSRAPGDCIRLYIEVDNDIHNDKGGVTGATNYISGLMNQVITLYANESISSVVSQIVVWDVTSPYSSTSSSGMLSDFQANISSINGNLGQLFSYQASGGIAAGFSGICNSNVDNSLCFSSINSTYSTVPTYSWSVMVATHEFGHLWGSRHTHACVWNGNNTAIDGCAGQTEGSCALPGYPSQGGTLMSYCHLQSVGINFNEGFGPQPGNVIRNSVNNASCTSPCGPPTCDDGIQNQDETGVDCGGVCPACPTCTDGIQNGDEEGIDCGGSDCAPCPCLDNGVTLTIVLDNYPEETTWQVVSGGNVIDSGGPYGSFPDGSTVVENICLIDGCFDFIIYDSYGDGLCCQYGSGSYTLTDDSDGSTLASGGAFGSSETTNFCVDGSPVIPGCMDPSAHNYDPAANQDDGSCETCSDGIQNGDETGVDCGGTNPNCSDCPIPGCMDPTAHNYNPGANVDDGSCETCSDGIQNGDEEGIDCGGTNPNCDDCTVIIPGCTDPDSHNYDPSATQDDGSCETCGDGVQNGDEEGVDCGGTNPNCAPCQTGCSYQVINFNNFDSGWGIWNDGGSDCRRSSKDGNYAVTGSPVRLRDNTSTSTTTTDNLDLTSYEELTVSFSYYPRSMDNSSEDFWLQVSTNGGGSYTTVEEWNKDDEFVNNQRYWDSVVIPGPFSSNTRLRFRCDASGNSDWIYLDDVEISGCLSSAAFINPDDNKTPDFETSLSLAPNPVNDILNVNYTSDTESQVRMVVMDVNGKSVLNQRIDINKGLNSSRVNVRSFSPGVYVLHIISDENAISKKFVVID